MKDYKKLNQTKWPEYTKNPKQKNNKPMQIGSVPVAWGEAKYMCMRCGFLFSVGNCPRCD